MTHTNAFIAQVYKQESDDPFLSLLTLTHPSFGNLYFVNNTESVISNGITFEPFPFELVLPADDGEAIKDIKLSLDNASLELIDELRSITDYIWVNLKLVLASNPDLVELELGELKINYIEYDASTITANLVMDNFLGTDLSSEKYTPSLYPGLFT